MKTLNEHLPKGLEVAFWCQREPCRVAEKEQGYMSEGIFERQAVIISYYCCFQKVMM